MNAITASIACIVLVFSYCAPAWSDTSVLGGELPLIAEATIIKERFEQGVGRLELETNTAPNEVADFYRKVMEEKGWPPGMVMAAGNQSVLMLNNQADQFVLKAKSKNGKTKVTIMLIQKAQTQPPAKSGGKIPMVASKQLKEPGVTEKRKREAKIKNKEALSDLPTVERAEVPCYVKIAASSELRVPIDTDRKAYLVVVNAAQNESAYTVLEYRNGKPKEGYEAKPWTLERKGHRKSWSFNDGFLQPVDEIRIKVEKGLIYAEMSQIGANQTDRYNGGGQSDHTVDPKRPFTLYITGDNPLGGQTTGKLRLRYEAGGISEAVPFTVETGKTLTWDFPADKGVNIVSVYISKGDGQAKISLIQLPYSKKAAP